MKVILPNRHDYSGFSQWVGTTSNWFWIKVRGAKRWSTFKSDFNKLLLESLMLLLDEPHNYLDDTHIQWLVRYLNNLKEAFY